MRGPQNDTWWPQMELTLGSGQRPFYLHIIIVIIVIAALVDCAFSLLWYTPIEIVYFMFNGGLFKLAIKQNIFNINIYQCFLLLFFIKLYILLYLQVL